MAFIAGAQAGSTAPHCESPPVDSCNPTHASTSMQGGQAVFENDNYRITADDNNTVTIDNKNTGESYQAWGDPHMNVDGQHSFDFWGKTTFQLEDGTKVTIDTTADKNHPGATLSSKVTITNGDYGAQISGVDSNKTGDLSINETQGWGRALDAVVGDGNTLHENPAGQGFLGVRDGQVRAVDQAYINQTDLQKGGAALNDKYKDAFRQLSSLQGIVFSGSLCRPGSAGGREEGSQPIEHHSTRPPQCGSQSLFGNALIEAITAAFSQRPGCHALVQPSECAHAPVSAPTPTPSAPPVDFKAAVPEPVEKPAVPAPVDYGRRGGGGEGAGGVGGGGAGGEGSVGAGVGL